MGLVNYKSHCDGCSQLHSKSLKCKALRGTRTVMSRNVFYRQTYNCSSRFLNSAYSCFDDLNGGEVFMVSPSWRIPLSIPGRKSQYIVFGVGVCATVIVYNFRNISALVSYFSIRVINLVLIFIYYLLQIYSMCRHCISFCGPKRI